MGPLNVAVVGLGYWGVNYLRVLLQISKINVKYLCDKDYKKLSNFRDKGYELVSDYRLLAEDPSLDVVFVITPASTHFDVAKLMLENGKHILVEKPLATKYADAVELWRLSKEVNRVLMTGHIYIYNSVIRYIKNMLEKMKLGRLYYGVGIRMGLGPIREDASCLWDLAPHELSILDYLLGKMPTFVSAQATCFLQKDRNIYDYAVAHMTYDDGFFFTTINSWYSSEKVRLINLVGSDKMIKFDDTDKSSPLKIYERGVSFEPPRPRVNYSAYQLRIREGNTLIPYINQDEPLFLQVSHFIDCVTKNSKPLTDGLQGARIVAILEAMDESIRKKGQLVAVEKVL